MKDPREVLRRKEAELQRLRQEVEALRIIGKFLSEQAENDQQHGKLLQMSDIHLA